MTSAHAAALANLNTLRAAATVALRAQNLASQDGTMADWSAAREAAKAPCAAEVAEVARLRAAGFGADLDFEFAVLGRLQRRHVDTVRA